MKFDILLTSKSLSIDKLSDNKKERHDVIRDLLDMEFSNREISDYMNDNNILTPRGGNYSPKLIWVTIKKIKEREERMNQSSNELGEMKFFLKKDFILEF